MDVLVDDPQIAEIDRQKSLEDIVVISAQVDDFRPLFFHLLQNCPDQLGVGIEPFPSTVQRPSIDDVSVEDEFLAARRLEELHDLLCLGIPRPKVNVGENNAAKFVFLHQ